MSRIINFLNELDDIELAYFAKFKYKTYMKETQKIILEYLLVKDLTKSKIDQLISSNKKTRINDGKKRCPRCFSDKIRKDKVKWTNTSGAIGLSDEIAILDGFIGKVTYKNEVVCNVCGFWLEDPNEEKS
ncbi:hypothetical protein UMM65_00990 [Aureibaculum sp. 2210JD6-5]|uniref:hypothetical protein n=1 Tax=Aureibaculum sp. 2210JD6-5 TaxID=3103957 RepID=UPI002AACCF66|nr:hypothetical protein [Aureibaculum sp. 2210JD6-5]MDY7393805.1 hypothetical protein [Aureibaculum sp. 2210JD6-5]